MNPFSGAQKEKARRKSPGLSQANFSGDFSESHAAHRGQRASASAP